jgi:hypothetical protein
MLQITNELLDEKIVNEYTTKSLRNIAREVGLSAQKVSANYTWLVRKGLIDPTLRLVEIEEQVKKTVSKLDKMESRFAQLEKIALGDNTYNNTDGIEKENGRTKIVNRVTTSGLTGTILTLPYMYCKLEKQILGVTSNYDFLGVEREEATYKAMKQRILIDELPIETYKGSISDKIYEAPREGYAHAILDYCGILSTFNREIEYFLREKLIPIKGTLHVTFSVNLRANGGNHDRVKELGNVINNSPTDLRSASEIAIRSFFDKVTGFDYRIDELYFYRDTNEKTNKEKTQMCLVQITRVA